MLNNFKKFMESNLTENDLKRIENNKKIEKQEWEDYINEINTITLEAIQVCKTAGTIR